MKAAILGGTFNPPHIGHLHIADEVLLMLDYEIVVFVPTNLPAHKDLCGEITASERWDMLSKAVASHPFFIADNCELNRDGISYSVDTVPDLINKYNITGKPGFILGDDLLQGFASWKNPEEISEVTDLIVVRRMFKEKIDFRFRHIYMDNLMIPISSKDIRRRISENSAVQFLLPDAVWKYIKDHDLYR